MAGASPPLKEVKAFLTQHHVDISGIFERSELLDRFNTLRLEESLSHVDRLKARANAAFRRGSTAYSVRLYTEAALAALALHDDPSGNTLLAALLVKVHASMGAEHAALLFGAGDAFYLTVVILVANFGVLVSVLLLLLLAGSRTALPRLRLTTTKAVPELTLAPSHKWHLFLRSACDRP